MSAKIGETGNFRKSASGGKGSVIPDGEQGDPQTQVHARAPSPVESHSTEPAWDTYYAELFDDDLSEEAVERKKNEGPKRNKASR